MRPTRGVAGLLLAAYVLHLLAGRTGAGWLALGAAAALALPVAAVLMRPRLGGLQVIAEPVRTRVGAAPMDRWEVRNTGSRPTPALRLTDRTPGLTPVVVAVGALAPGESVIAELQRDPVSRGRWDSRELELTSTAPFGLLRSSRRLTGTALVSVGPRSVPASSRALAGAGSAGAPSAQAGLGTEVLGLRPWRVGDGAAAVSARASARHGRPVVLERERDSGARLVVVCTGAGSGSEWEAAIERSCALVERAVQDGVVPQLLATGVPTPTRLDRQAVVDWHAALDRAQPLDHQTVSALRRATSAGVGVLGPPTAALAGLTWRAL